MKASRKQDCYFPQLSNKSLVIHFADYGICASLQITNVGDAVGIAGIWVNDEFAPSVELSNREWFSPLALPRILLEGECLRVVLSGPSTYLETTACYAKIPRKVVIRLAGGVLVQFEDSEIIRTKI